MLPEGIRRLFRLGRARDAASELDEELAFHFEEKTRALMAGGLGEAEARAEAQRQFGDLPVVREELLRADQRRGGRAERAEWWDGVWQDLRFAVRGLRRSPALTLAVVLMLGLGIGGAAAMYGLLDRLLFQVGPHVSRPEELRRLYVKAYDNYRHRVAYTSGFRIADQLAIQQALPGRPPIAAIVAWDARLGGPGGPEVPVGLTSGATFQVLGTTPAAGRLLQPSDDQPGAPPVAVISHRLWQREFGGQDDAIGRTLRLGRVIYTIVGVAPPGFSGLRHSRVDAWVPVQIGAPAHYGPHWKESAWMFEVVVRLGPDHDAAALSGAAQVAYRGLIAGRHDADSAATARFESVIPGRRPDGFSSAQELSLIVGGVAAMLCLIAVANATILLLLRAVQRGREIAVRLALGVSRGRLVRAVISESLLLAAGGALAAGLVARWAAELLQKLIVRNEWQLPVMSPAVMAFAAALALLIGLVTGFIPGWQASRPEALAALKSGTRATGGGTRLRSGLLVMQAALTVVLIAGLSLYVRSFLKASAVDYVVDVERLIGVSVRPAEDTVMPPGWLAGASKALSARLREVPGVAGVAVATIAPTLGYSGAALRAEGVDSLRMDHRGPFITEIDEEFLRITGLRVVRGRAFTAEDVSANAPVSLVNDALAQRLWAGQEPLGKCLYIGRRGTPPGDLCRPVVGVVTSYRNELQETAPMQNYYVPLGYRGVEARYGGGGSVIVRTEGRPDELLPTLLSLVRQSLPHTNPEDVMSLEARTDADLAPWRSGATLFGMFAALAMLLAMGGLYSVVAFSVAQRRHEFGIRIAIGATARDLAALVMSRALRPVGAGLLLGLALALWLGRYLGPLLFELSPRDPLALGGAALVLLAAAALAAVPPARTAARSDAREALQAE